MTRKIRIEWNSIYEQFFVRDANRGVELPNVSISLLDDVNAWMAHLSKNFEPDDTVTTGVWKPGTRQWFVDEAGRLEDEFRRELAGSGKQVRVSPYPGIIPIRVYVDYNDWPLWTNEGATGPEHFPMLSDQLRNDLIAWAGSIDAGTPPEEVGADFKRRLSSELGPFFDITY